MKEKKVLTLIIISLAFGLLGGFFGEIFSRGLFLGEPYGLSSLGEVNLSNFDYNEKNLVIREPKKVVVNQNVKNLETIASAKESFLGVYKKQTTAQRGDFSLNDYYKTKEELAFGLAISSDGWLLLNDYSRLNLNNLKTDYVAIDSEGRIYAFDDFSEDKKHGLLFAHLKEANNLIVKNFTPRSELRPTYEFLFLNLDDKAYQASLFGFNNSEKILNSDEAKEEMLFNSTLPNALIGSWIFNLGSEVSGLVGKDGKAYPISNYTSIIFNFLKSRQASSTYLGVSYLPLYDLVYNSGQYRLATAEEKGVLLLAREDRPAVVKGSPADLAGLIAGDIILSFDGVALDSNNDLRALLEANLAGEEVLVKYRRGEENKETKVKLDIMK